MNKEELLRWIEVYDKSPYNNGIEEELRKKFQENNFITKSDLIQIVKWKFQGKVSWKGDRILKHLDNVDESFIEEISKLSFQYKDDELRLKLFSCIDGIGLSLSSVILAFYVPKNYGILDIHAWRGLFGKESVGLFSNKKHAITFFKKLREISSKTGLSCRDIEKAYFQKDKEGESKSQTQI